MNTDVNPRPRSEPLDDTDLPDVDSADSGRSVARRSRRSRRFAALMRWLHIYVSMFCFTIVLFFSVTGLTLNHADWFYGGQERLVKTKGTVETRWLQGASRSERDDSNGGRANAANDVNKLEVVEHLRRTHDVRGALADFTADDQECNVAFKGPGYSANAFIDRATGEYELEQTWFGVVAVINDLHKGRDSGTAWSWVIDLSAVLMTFVSLTGLVLLFYLKQRRRPGLIVAVVGTVVVVAIYRLWVP